MTDKKGKRAVVINNIKSGSIEQAIFILKTSAGESAGGVGSAIVAEAQEIINNYICMVEGSAKRKFTKNKKMTIFAAGAIGFLATILGLMAIL